MTPVGGILSFVQLVEHLNSLIRLINVNLEAVHQHYQLGDRMQGAVSTSSLSSIPKTPTTTQTVTLPIPSAVNSAPAPPRASKLETSRVGTISSTSQLQAPQARDLACIVSASGQAPLVRTTPDRPTSALDRYSRGMTSSVCAPAGRMYPPHPPIITRPSSIPPRMLKTAAPKSKLHLISSSAIPATGQTLHYGRQSQPSPSTKKELQFPAGKVTYPPTSPSASATGQASPLKPPTVNIEPQLLSVRPADSLVFLSALITEQEP